jgi:DNA invertase Pin-like site-specific DNA recombinase
MKVFAYLRVSGKGQIDGDGFDRQRAAIEKFCAARGWLVARWFSEPAVSGTTDYDDRPAFVEMLSLMGGVQPTIFVVENPDRLARDLIVSEALIAECASEVRVVCRGEIDLSVQRPSRVFIRQVFGAIAQLDKSNLVRKLRSARDRKRASGQRCEGPKPYEERGGADVCRSIFEMRERGATFQEIADWLRHNKVKPPGGAVYWHKSTAHAIYVRYSRSFGNVEPLRVNKSLAHEIGHVLPQPPV